MKKILSVLILFLFLSPSVYGETLTLSTYYPAPFGSYDRLRLVPRSAAPVCNASLEGLLFYNGTTDTMRVCEDSGLWEPIGLWDKDGLNVFLDNPDPENNFFVGIGDSTPDAVFEISGKNLGDDLLMLSSDENTDGDFLVVKGNGRVGIGDPNPGSMMVIHGAGISDATSSLLVVDDNGDAILFVRDDGRVGVGVGPTDLMSMDSRLTVSGNIDLKVSGADSQIRFQETDSGAWYSMGIDKSDGGKFKINFGSSVGETNQFIMTPSGDLILGKSVTLKDGANEGEVQVQWVADPIKPGYYATYAP